MSTMSIISIKSVYFRCREELAILYSAARFVTMLALYSLGLRKKILKVHNVPIPLLYQTNLIGFSSKKNEYPANLKDAKKNSFICICIWFICFFKAKLHSLMKTKHCNGLLTSSSRSRFPLRYYISFALELQGAHLPQSFSRRKKVESV